MIFKFYFAFLHVGFIIQEGFLINFIISKRTIVKNTFLLFFLFCFFGSLSAQKVVMKNGQFYGPDERPFTGIFKEYDANGALVSENCVSNGLLDSISTIYYPAGTKKEQRSYKEGKKHGLWINWAPNEVKTAEARFKDGNKEGFWYIWDELGTKRYEMYYVAGQKKGMWYI